MKDIFFVDVDDTILDFHASSDSALRYAFEKNQIAYNDHLASLYKIFNDSLWLGLEQKKITREQILSFRFTYFFESLDMKEVDGDAVNRDYLEYLSTHPIYFEGAEEFLKKLGKMGRIYFVTNGTEKIQKSRFEIANLYPYALNTFISQVAGFDKPSKGYVDYVLSNVEDYDKERAVWIGDSLSADVASAKVAGMTSIWFNPRKKQLKGEIIPDFQAENYEEILKILQK